MTEETVNEPYPCPTCGEALFDYPSGLTLHVMSQEPDCAVPEPVETVEWEQRVEP